MCFINYKLVICVLVYTVFTTNCASIPGNGDGAPEESSLEFENPPARRCSNPSQVCIPFYDCPNAGQQVKQKRKLEICGFRDKIAKVCCNSTAESRAPKLFGMKSNAYCKKHSKASDDLEEDSFSDNDKTRIVEFVSNGKVAPPTTFLYMAAIGFENGTIAWDCGGILISERYVLTAAHCLHKVGMGDAKYVRLGDRNIASADDDQYVQEYNVTEKKSYMLYKPPAYYHDIGLIKLDRSVNFTKRVRPACLFTALQLPNSYQVAGWGAVGPKGKKSNILLSTVLSHFGTEECNTKVAFNINRQYPKGILSDIQVCAGDQITRSDTCAGDSGGPLQVKVQDIPYIVGVTSNGLSCGHQGIPGVYTRLYSYLKWIEDVVWPDEEQST